jgi:uncharacterized cupredoxin-like copper-binding protein
MKLKFTSLIAALAVGALVVAGCGSSNSSSSDSTASSSDTGAAAPPATTTDTTTPTDPGSSSSGGGGAAQDLKLSADPGGALMFNTTKLSAKAGKVTLTLDNPAPVPHAIAVEGNGVDMDGKTVTKGSTSTVTADLKPGTYTFYCPVPGHRQAGMQGTLTVK